MPERPGYYPSIQTLRRAALHHQGLSKSAHFGAGMQATLKALEHLGYVQIDTLAVVERAHHHTLWTRIPSYKPAHLEQLIKERKVFEYWSHAAAFLPMRDYRFALPRMNSVKRGESNWFASVTRKDEKQVLERIRSDGPLMARDFNSPKEQAGSWWNWKPAKKTLEKLFFQGDLMISSRAGMQKVYDLRERVLPDAVDTSEPSLREFADYLINSALRAHGFTTVKQITHLRSGTPLRKMIQTLLQQRIENGELVAFTTEELPTVYARTDFLEQKLPKARAVVQFLSPFDNAIIHRDRVKQLFDFDYTLECYTAPLKRRYGYFCLPILYANALVGRADCKANRATRHLEVLRLYVEKSDRRFNLDAFNVALEKAVQLFAGFNDCDSFSISKSIVLPKV